MTKVAACFALPTTLLLTLPTGLQPVQHCGELTSPVRINIGRSFFFKSHSFQLAYRANYKNPLKFSKTSLQNFKMNKVLLLVVLAAVFAVATAGYLRAGYGGYGHGYGYRTVYRPAVYYRPAYYGGHYGGHGYGGYRSYGYGYHG